MSIPLLLNWPSLIIADTFAGWSWLMKNGGNRSELIWFGIVELNACWKPDVNPAVKPGTYPDWEGGCVPGPFSWFGKGDAVCVTDAEVVIRFRFVSEKVGTVCWKTWKIKENHFGKPEISSWKSFVFFF